jgi:chromosomal replication initiator protein
MNICPYVYVGLETSQVIKPSELLDKAMKLICEQKGVQYEEVIGKRRLHALVMSRHEFSYIARTKTKLSLEFIGCLLGGKDHATILHSARTFKNLLDTNANIRENHFAIMRKLNFVNN